jgi:hypothetical protein
MFVDGYWHCSSPVHHEVRASVGGSGSLPPAKLLVSIHSDELLNHSTYYLQGDKFFWPFEECGVTCVELSNSFLEAWELMRLDLRADLVVLSACETARGRFGAGEGMIGLTWALFVAGAPATVVSQWKVESASARDLMISFHKGLMTPKTPKAEALRQAALSLLKSPETSHPFYWAGFALVGDGE